MGAAACAAAAPAANGTFASADPAPASQPATIIPGIGTIIPGLGTIIPSQNTITPRPLF